MRKKATTRFYSQFKLTLINKILQFIFIKKNVKNEQFKVHTNMREIYFFDVIKNLLALTA